MGVNAALITIYDLSKIVNPDLLIQDVRLLVKQGGKSGLWINPNGVPEFISSKINMTSYKEAFTKYLKYRKNKKRIH